MSSNPFISSGGAFTNLNQLQIHCSPYEWWVSLRSGYTHSRGKFSYDIENFTKSLYLRRLVQGNSCFLAGFLTFMIRDVFILLELLTCAWKCEFPQAPVCFWWQVDSLLPKISTFMKTWDLEFWNILSRNVWALVWLISGSIVFSYIQSQRVLHSRSTWPVTACSSSSAVRILPHDVMIHSLNVLQHNFVQLNCCRFAVQICSANL